MSYVVLATGCSTSHDQATASDESTSVGATSVATTDDDSVPLDVGGDGPALPAPDCADLVLPGADEDVAATPRADRDAETLALRLDPSRFVAAQADYVVIAEDLVAIRALDPIVGDVHIECEIPLGYDFWFSRSEIVDAVWLGNYHAWDCHNLRYGIEHRPVGEGGHVWRTDGLAFAMQVDGVYAPAAFIELYASIPGLDDAGITPKWRLVSYDPNECVPMSGSIALDADSPAALADGARTYAFTHPTEGLRTYYVAPGEAPVLVE